MMNNDLYILLEVISERTIAFNPLISKITGSVKSGVLLSQFMYWWKGIKKAGRTDFWKTQTEIQEETTLSVREIKSALQQLKELGFITITLKGLPATNYFTLNEDRIIEALMTTQSTTRSEDISDSTKCPNLIAQNVPTSENKMSQLDDTKCPNKIGQNVPTLNITKTTTNTTSKITTDIKNKQKKENPQCLVDENGMVREITYTDQYTYIPTFSKSAPKLVNRIDNKNEKNIREVIDYFNQTCKTNLTGDIQTIKNITTILGEFSVDDIKLVIDHISQDEWHIQHNEVLLSGITRKTLFNKKLEKAKSWKNNPVKKPAKFNDMGTFTLEDSGEIDMEDFLRRKRGE